MKKHSFLHIFALFALSSFSLMTSSCDDDSDTPETKQTITQLVVNDPNFSILEAAVVKAGLADALSSGTLTVFAPDNAAFQSVGITEAAIASLPVSRVDSILKYHVLNGFVTSDNVPVSDAVTTLLGTKLFASRNANGVFVNGIKVKQADIEASNGTVHVIQSVLIPPTQTIAQIAAGSPVFSTLVAAVDKAGLLGAISGPGKFTVFAPTNDAFVAAGITDITAVPETTVQTVVQYHVLGTNVFASDLVNNAAVQTIQGGNIVVSIPPAGVKIQGSTKAVSKIIQADIVATNGVIHVIDLTLLP
jgi:uncharacterized surface protein with fasciclin (FAS1) repeats